MDAGGELIQPGLALFGAFHRFADQCRSILGSAGATLGQRADFIGHHRESFAALARARRFHRCIERQQVGLNAFVNDLDDLRSPCTGMPISVIAAMV